MIRAKVELISITMRTRVGGGGDLFVHSLKGGIKGPITIETKNVARKSNTPTSLDGVSLMAGKFSVRHCSTLILPKYDESVVFVNIIENGMRAFSFSLHPHILKQRSLQEDV